MLHWLVLLSQKGLNEFQLFVEKGATAKLTGETPSPHE